MRQPGQHGASRRPAPPPQPARCGAVPEDAAPPGRLHGAGRPGGDGAEVRPAAGLERRHRGADEDPGDSGEVSVDSTSENTHRHTLTHRLDL